MMTQRIKRWRGTNTKVELLLLLLKKSKRYLTFSQLQSRGENVFNQTIKFNRSRNNIISFSFKELYKLIIIITIDKELVRAYWKVI